MTRPRPIRGARRRHHRSSTRYATLDFSLTRLHSFATLVSIWLKHRLMDRFRPEGRQDATIGRRGARERIYVDASFKPSEDGKKGVGGIGVWLPRRRIAIAFKVNVRSSMEAEILALAAGSLAAQRLGVKRPVILSDCKSAVRTASRLMNIGRVRGTLHKLVRLAEISHEHRAFRHVYNSMHGLRGSLAWEPRERNREADLASNIGSRVGNMCISLSGGKNKNHALNDVLSRALEASLKGEGQLTRGKIEYRTFHRGNTRTVRFRPRRVPSSRAFLRKAPRLIAKLSAKVA